MPLTSLRRDTNLDPQSERQPEPVSEDKEAAAASSEEQGTAPILWGPDVLIESDAEGAESDAEVQAALDQCGGDFRATIRALLKQCADLAVERDQAVEQAWNRALKAESFVHMDPSGKAYRCIPILPGNPNPHPNPDPNPDPAGATGGL